MKRRIFLAVISLLMLAAGFVTKTALADNVISDDSIITGSQCIGYDCLTDGTENFGFDTIRLKENNLRIKFDDTSATAGFPATDWQIIVNDSASGGRNYFGVDNVTATQSVLRIYDNGSMSVGQAATATAVTNATAIGANAYVATADSLVLGSVNGINGATSSVNVGIGTTTPVRQLHVVGDQAVFRMDRPTDTAAFMLVRTDAGGTPLKTFVVGANASGSNNGSFVINDLGTGVSGAGTRRLTIDNNGIATFTGSVYATSFVPTSSLVYKTNVKTYENALETVKKLRGVSFDWKDSGKPSVGLIAEEVDKVIPAAVAHNDKDATGVNYDSLVGVLVEAVKEQQGLIQEQQAELDTLKEQKILIQEQQKSIAALSQKVSELERLLFISNAVSNAD
jgi:hypothetical protein